MIIVESSGGLLPVSMTQWKDTEITLRMMSYRWINKLNITRHSAHVTTKLMQLCKYIIVKPSNFADCHRLKNDVEH